MKDTPQHAEWKQVHSTLINRARAIQWREKPSEIVIQWRVRSKNNSCADVFGSGHYRPQIPFSASKLISITPAAIIEMDLILFVFFSMFSIAPHKTRNDKIC